jgi:hypothetical protein
MSDADDSHAPVKLGTCARPVIDLLHGGNLIIHDYKLLIIIV